MSHKRRSGPSTNNKQESQQIRSNNHHRRTNSYERHYYPIQSNRQNDYYDQSVSIDEIINHAEEYPPMIQSLVGELLLEQKKRKLVEEKLNIYEHDYAYLHAQHEQTINNLNVLKHDFDQCRLDLKTSCIELNELRHANCQYRLRIDQLLENERQQMYVDDEAFYTKRQRRY